MKPLVRVLKFLKGLDEDWDLDIIPMDIREDKGMPAKPHDVGTLTGPHDEDEYRILITKYNPDIRNFAINFRQFDWVNGSKYRDGIVFISADEIDPHLWCVCAADLADNMKAFNKRTGKNGAFFVVTDEWEGLHLDLDSALSEGPVVPVSMRHAENMFVP